jgi:YD repeat-containing protein
MPVTSSFRGYLASLADDLGTLGSYEYDLPGRVTRQVLPDGREILYSYDANGNVTSITPPGRSAFKGIQSYTGFGETAAFSGAHDGTALFSNSFLRDARGRIIEKPETVAGTTTTYGYLYDTAGRLIRVTQDGATAAEYAYDEKGNRLQRTFFAG